jgi:MFS family permease
MDAMGDLPRHRSLELPTGVRFGVLAFVCSLSLLTYLDRVCIMRVEPDICRDLGLDDIAFGHVFAAFMLGYGLFEVHGGWMGDRWGPRLVVTRIVLWWSAFTALTGCVWYFAADSPSQLYFLGHPLLSSFGLLLLIRFLFGAGEAGAYPNVTRVVRTWFPVQERARAQGAVWMCARLGGAVAPAIIGSLTRAFGNNWRAAFWTLGGLGVAWAAVFFAWFRDRPEQMPGCNEAERELIRAGRPPGPEHAAGHAWPPVGILVGSVTVWAMCVASFAVCFGWYFYPTWQPKYLLDVFGIDYKDSELLTGLPFLCGAGGCLLGGWLSDRLVLRSGSRRWGRSLVGLVGFVGAGLCVLATGFVADPRQAVALLCLAFFINDLAIPTLWAAIADVGGRFVGTLAGLMNMVGAAGGILSPVLIPVAQKALARYPAALRWQILFAGLAVSWFVAAAAWLFIDAGRPLFEARPAGERGA